MLKKEIIVPCTYIHQVRKTKWLFTKIISFNKLTIPIKTPTRVQSKMLLLPNLYVIKVVQKLPTTWIIPIITDAISGGTLVLAASIIVCKYNKTTLIPINWLPAPIDIPKANAFKKVLFLNKVFLIIFSFLFFEILYSSISSLAMISELRNFISTLNASSFWPGKI